MQLRQFQLQISSMMPQQAASHKADNILLLQNGWPDNFGDGPMRFCSQPEEDVVSLSLLPAESSSPLQLLQTFSLDII